MQHNVEVHFQALRSQLVGASTFGYYKIWGHQKFQYTTFSLNYIYGEQYDNDGTDCSTWMSSLRDLVSDIFRTNKQFRMLVNWLFEPGQ